jgi:hypothetical protein
MPAGRGGILQAIHARSGPRLCLAPRRLPRWGAGCAGRADAGARRLLCRLRLVGAGQRARPFGRAALDPDRLGPAGPDGADRGPCRRRLAAGHDRGGGAGQCPAAADGAGPAAGAARAGPAALVGLRRRPSGRHHRLGAGDAGLPDPAAGAAAALFRRLRRRAVGVLRRLDRGRLPPGHGGAGLGLARPGLPQPALLHPGAG